MAGPYPRICFFGCGEMAGRHSRTLRSLFPGIPLLFASRDLAKARKYAEKYGGIGAFGSYEEGIREGGFDISFLTTPPAVHAELARLSAEEGKDLIIEKPVTRTLDELAEVRTSVEKSGVRCTVAENYFFKPIIPAVRGFIEEGRIGEVLFIELTKAAREEKTGWRLDEGLMGGGALLEGGVHWLNALTSLSGGAPTDVLAVKPGVCYSTDIPFEDSLLVVVRYSNGAVGRLLHSWRIPTRFFGLGLSKVWGTEGTITLESNGLFCSVNGNRRKRKFMNPREFLGFRPMHRSLIQNWMDGRPWQPTLERIRQDLEVVHAAYRSLATERFEKV